MRRIATALCLLAAGVLCVLVGGAQAEESVDGEPARLADLKPGEHWSGPEVAPQDLQGKVVLFVLWGS